MRSIHRRGGVHRLKYYPTGLDVRRAGSVHESAATDGATWAKRA